MKSQHWLKMFFIINQNSITNQQNIEFFSNKNKKNERAQIAYRKCA